MAFIGTNVLPIGQSPPVVTSSQYVGAGSIGVQTNINDDVRMEVPEIQITNYVGAGSIGVQTSLLSLSMNSASLSTTNIIEEPVESVGIPSILIQNSLPSSLAPTTFIEEQAVTSVGINSATNPFLQINDTISTVTEQNIPSMAIAESGLLKMVSPAEQVISTYVGGNASGVGTTLGNISLNSGSLASTIFIEESAGKSLGIGVEGVQKPMLNNTVLNPVENFQDEGIVKSIGIGGVEQLPQINTVLNPLTYIPEGYTITTLQNYLMTLQSPPENINLSSYSGAQLSAISTFLMTMTSPPVTQPVNYVGANAPNLPLQSHYAPERPYWQSYTSTTGGGGSASTISSQQIFTSSLLASSITTDYLYASTQSVSSLVGVSTINGVPVGEYFNVSSFVNLYTSTLYAGSTITSTLHAYGFSNKPAMIGSTYANILVGGDGVQGMKIVDNNMSTAYVIVKDGDLALFTDSGSDESSIYMISNKNVTIASGGDGNIYLENDVYIGNSVHAPYVYGDEGHFSTVQAIGTLTNETFSTLSTTISLGGEQNPGITLTDQYGHDAKIQQIHGRGLSIYNLDGDIALASPLSTINFVASTINTYGKAEITGGLKTTDISANNAQISSLTGVSSINGVNTSTFLYPMVTSSFTQLYTSSLLASTVTLNGDLTVNPGVNNDVLFGTSAVAPIKNFHVYAGDVSINHEFPGTAMTMTALGDMTLTSGDNLDLYGDDVNIFTTGTTSVMSLNAIAAMTLTTGAALTVNAGGAVQIGAGGHVNIGSLSGFGTEIEDINIDGSEITKVSGSANLEIQNVSTIQNNDSIATKGSMFISAKEELVLNSQTSTVNILAPSSMVQVSAFYGVQVEDFNINGNTIYNATSDIVMLPNAGTGKVSVQGNLMTSGSISTPTVLARSTFTSSLTAGVMNISSAHVSSVVIPPLTIVGGQNIGANISCLNLLASSTQTGGLRMDALALNGGTASTNDIILTLSSTTPVFYLGPAQGFKPIAFQQSGLTQEFYSTSFTHSEGIQMNANIGRFNTLEPKGPQTFIEVPANMTFSAGTTLTGDNAVFQHLSSLNEMKSKIVQTSTLELLNDTPGVSTCYLLGTTLTGTKPSIWTTDSNYVENADIVIYNNSNGSFPALFLIDNANGTPPGGAGAGITYRFNGGGDNQVLRTGVGFESYSYHRATKRINEGYAQFQLQASNYPAPGQFSTATFQYVPFNNESVELNRNLFISGSEQPALTLYNGTTSGTILYDNIAPGFYNRFYFSGAGIGCSDFISMDGAVSPYFQFYSFDYANSGNLQWHGNSNLLTMNKPLIVGTEYGNNAFVGITDGFSVAKMGFDGSFNRLWFNKDISGQNALFNTLEVKQMIGPNNLYQTGNLDSTITVTTSGFDGPMNQSGGTAINWPYQQNLYSSITVHTTVLASDSPNHHTAWIARLVNNTLSTFVDSYSAGCNAYAVSQPISFGGNTSQTVSWTDTYDIPNTWTTGHNVTVEIGAQVNSGSGTFTGTYNWTLMPVKYQF